MQPQPKPRTTREVAVCEPVPGRCGVATPTVPVVVEVPDGAHLGPPRTVEFPIDVKVELEANDEHGRPKICQPPP